MIKAVLFDYGGVLSESGKVGAIADTLGELYGADPSKIRIADLHHQLVTGAISEQDFFAELDRRYGNGKTITAEVFNANNQSFAKPCQLVYDLATRLRAAGIITGILSNVYAISASQLRQAGMYDNFDPVILSCDEHAAKPDPILYQNALQKLGLPGSEVLFIDDQQRFMPPESMGLHTILAVSPQQIVDDVTALFKKENNLTLG